MARGATADPLVIGQHGSVGSAIRGRVIDLQGRPIRGATVSILTAGGTRSATTDADGRYALVGAPRGGDLLVIRPGYTAGLATVGPASPGGDGEPGEGGAVTQIDDVVLTTDDSAETIAITAAAPIAAQGAGALARADLERLPGAGNDPIRALDAMPGVVSFPLPLADSGVAIRGASPQDSKILIDGFEVPALYHNIGFRSIVPAEAIDKLEYIPGGFDVGFGRASSGIVNLTTRAGSDRAEQQAEVSSSDASALAQGSLPDGHYLIAVRRSVIDRLLPALLPDDLDLALTTVPRYYDGELRLDYAPSSRWALRLSGLGSDDELELYTSRSTTPDKRLYDRTRFLRMTAAAAYHDGPWTANLAISGIAQQRVFERGAIQHLSVSSPGATARAELTGALGSPAGLSDLVWRLGSELAVSRSAIDLALPTEHREGEPAGVDDPMDSSQRFAGPIWNADAAVWSSLSASLDPRVRLTAGVRLDSFTRVHDTALQPRAELVIKLNPTTTARISAGAYRRPPEYQTELLYPTLAAERATQLVAGLALQPRDTLQFQGSIYATDRSHLITRTADQLGNSGSGTTYGAELLATLHDGPWFGWLSYAYSRSTRIDQPGAASRLFDYDQPHSLNLAASYRFGRFQLGGRFRLYSGLPQTPVTGAVFDSDANRYTPIYGPVNSERAPLHHELDLRLDRQWTWGPVKMTYFLDVQNVYLNQTAVAYIYSFDYQQRAAYRGLPIMPSAGLRGEL